MEKNKTKKEIDRLLKIVAPLKQRIFELTEEEILKVQRPRLLKMVGFSLSSNFEPKAYYGKILDLVESKFGLEFILEVCSINKEGTPQIRLESASPYTNKEWWDAEVPLHGWDKCSDVEYLTFKAKVMSELSSQKSLRAWLLRQK